MNNKIIFREALNLRSADRLQLIKWLAKSLHQPNERIERIWVEEAQRRYAALKTGKV
jgi:hypothetical protein